MVGPLKTFKLSERELWLAEQNPTGFLVALWLDSDTASKLALPSGESPESLHITLAFCGDASEMGELGQARAITAIDDAVRYWDRLEGKIAGYGRFVNSAGGDEKDVFYLTPDVPRLIELRQCVVNCLFDSGVAVSTEHGYTPHITLAYLDFEADNPLEEVEPTPLTFVGVTIMSGTRRIDIPFWLPPSSPEATISMSEQSELPPEALLGSQPARPLYFGSFDKEWIPFLPKPGTYHHEVYGDMDLTSTAYTEMLQNFDRYVYKQDLPIRATHTPGDTGAVGWIKPGGMRLADDGSLEVKPEWNELGKGLVQDDRFKYVSAEFCKVWTNPVTQERTPNVAIGLALVTRPHFKTDVLNPLSEREALAFAESAIVEIAVGEEGNQMPPEDQVVTPPVAAAPLVPEVTAAATPEVPAAPVVAAAPIIAPAVSLNDLTQVVITAEQRNTERRMFDELTERVSLAERRAETAETAMKRMAADRRTEKFTAEVIGQSAENGTQWFGSIEENVKHLVSLAEQFGDDSTEVRWAVKQKRTEASAIKATGIFDPIALGASEEGKSIESRVNHLAEQIRMADPKISMDRAISQVYNEHPELYVQSIRASR